MKTLIVSIAATGLLAIVAMAQTSHLSYSVLDLGAVAGPPEQPYYISANGLIAGAAGTADNRSHAAVWFMGLKFDLGYPALGGPNSAAYGFNAKGQGVGAAQTNIPDHEDFCGFNAYGVLPSLTSCWPFIWQNGAMTALPGLGGPNGVANVINNQGEAVGYVETPARDPSSSCPVQQFAPVLWTKGGVTRLKTFAGDPDGVAAAINDNGQAVGASGSCTAFNSNSGLYLLEKHALLWDGGSVVDLGNLGGTGAGAGHHACALNNRGEVVGHSDLKGDVTFHGFVWTWQSGMRDIGTLPGDAASLALGVSDQGIIVGASLDANFNPRAVLFEDGAMIDLNTVLTSNPQKLYLLFAQSINVQGQFVGLAASADGTLHGFLATPERTGRGLQQFERQASPELSLDARKVVFRRLGIRGR